MDTQLIVIDPQEFGLEKTEAQNIEKVFTPMLAKMSELEQEYNEIVILPMGDETSKKARDLRLRFVKTRTATDEIRVKAKAYYLAGGRFVDAWGNAQKFAAIGKEEKLEAIEKHFENIEKERKEKLHTERCELLRDYVSDTSLYNLREMTDEEFTKLLADSKIAFQAIKDAEVTAEKERVEREAEALAEQARIREENKKLQEEAAERDAKVAEAVAAQKKAEADLKAKQVSEEADRKAKASADRKAKNAPDKVKLLAYAETLSNIAIPQFVSEEATQIMGKVVANLKHTIELIKNEAENL